MSDEYEIKPIRILPTLFSLVACFCILCLPKGMEYSFVSLSACMVTSGLYFASAQSCWSGKRGWKFDFGLGILWLLNAAIHILAIIALNMPKPE